MSKRYLSESAAWDTIAAAFDQYDEKKSYWQDDPLVCWGLCSAVGELERQDRISSDTYSRMDRRLRGFGGRERGFWWWPLNNAGAAQRVYACALLSLLAKEDAP